MAPRVYFDTNVFITAFEVAGPLADHAWRLIQSSEAGDIAGVTSELTLAELLSKPPEDHPALSSHFDRIITDGPALRVLPVDRAVLLEAATIRRLSSATKLPDAIHLATARLHGCTHFVSDDLRVRPGLGLTIVRLGPQSLDAIGRPAS